MPAPTGPRCGRPYIVLAVSFQFETLNYPWIPSLPFCNASSNWWSNCHFWLKYGKLAKFCPFLRSYWRLEFNAQIAGNGISGVLILKIFRGGMLPDPHRKPRAFAARSMTNNFWLASPLLRCLATILSGATETCKDFQKGYCEFLLHLYQTHPRIRITSFSSLSTQILVWWHWACSKTVIGNNLPRTALLRKPYSESLQQSGLSSLFKRREELCKNLFSKITSDSNHKLRTLLRSYKDVNYKGKL
jgi:hypothetical protein